MMSERATFNSSRFVVGSQPPTTTQCEGAPALDHQGVFGVVTSCPPDKVPVVSKLSALRSFLRRNVPGLIPERSTS